MGVSKALWRPCGSLCGNAALETGAKEVGQEPDWCRSAGRWAPFSLRRNDLQNRGPPGKVTTPFSTPSPLEQAKVRIALTWTDDGKAFDASVSAVRRVEMTDDGEQVMDVDEEANGHPRSLTLGSSKMVCERRSEPGHNPGFRSYLLLIGSFVGLGIRDRRRGPATVLDWSWIIDSACLPATCLWSTASRWHYRSRRYRLSKMIRMSQPRFQHDDRMENQPWPPSVDLPL
jgi:hypothetical protein